MKIFILILISLFTPNLTFASEEVKFSDFLNYFHKINLPISITKDNYTDFIGDKIPDDYINNFFNICCPEVRAIGKISSNHEYVIVLYNIIWSGSNIGIRTFTQNGKEISAMTIAKFDMDMDDPSYQKVYIKASIDRNFHISIATNHLYSEIDRKTNKIILIKNEMKIEKYNIDENGKIKKIL